MTSQITISQFRVSFIWFETILSLLAEDVPDQKDVPFYFLGRNNTYESMFNQIQHKSAGTIKLTLPWRVSPNETPPSHFWRYYLNGHETNNVTPRLAWEGFVPFRGMAPYTVEADWIPGQFIQEAFYYPHGVAYVATARCEGSFSLNEFVDLALNIGMNAEFKNTTTGQNLYLNNLAATSLDNLRTAGWGSKKNRASARAIHS